MSAVCDSKLVQLATGQTSPVRRLQVDMMADIEVNMVPDMEIDMVADTVATKVFLGVFC